ncbi:FHA domain-containing protein [Actinomadura alba]|uniref:FHA domain-containing protein n=1 Tax=Actinomadura alba TaxID=406431 RepID=A0ABR7LRG1_9ACTN|nr:FHA domain-containing protein [Actinomadura alba]MBC6467082.1 FHA domain-containing protein [Actinomadura alba]
MASLTCPTCGAAFEPGDLICLDCGANLARVREVTRRHPPTREEQPPQRPPAPRPEPAQEQHAPRNPSPAENQSPPPAPHRPPPQRPAQQWAPQEQGPPPHMPPERRGAPPPRSSAHSAPPPPPPARREETLIPPEEEQVPQRPERLQETTAFMCPHCEAPLSNPGAVQCETCLRPLRQQAPVLRLVFATGELRVALGQHLVLGRDAGQSPVAATFTRYDNVSRRHSTVWLDPAGAAWVRDERSTNGTFVNDQRLPPGAEAPLRDGDALRLAADATGTVHLN